MSGHVFLSYSRSDRAYVDKLASYLFGEDLPVWYDHGLVAGDRFATVIQHRIDMCAAFVVVLTPAAMASDWVKDEIEYALNKGKPVLPLLLARCTTHIRLVGLHREDVTGERMPSSAFLGKIAHLVRAGRGTPVATSTSVGGLTNVATPAAAGPEAVDAPAGVHNLPAISAVFVGRDLAVVDDAVANGAAVIGQAVHGLGGVGKTELAAHYAHAHPDRYRLRWWITADTPDNITLGLAGLTERLHPLPELSAARAWAVGWLQTHRGWLLVLDNVEDPDHIRDLLGALRGCGHVLVTTRRDLGAARWIQLGLAPLRLDVLDRAESVSLLHRLTCEHDPEQAGRLAADLGDLPLALEQAAAYVTQNPGLGLAGYRRLLAEHPEHVYATAGLGSHPDRAVSRVWQLTMTRIAEQSPPATHLLAVLSYLAPDAIPEAVLPPLGDQPTRNEVLTVLASYSMIIRAGGVVSVHRLVQAITRARVDADRADGGGVSGPLADAVAVLAGAAPGDPLTNVDGWELWRVLLPHVAAVLDHLPPQHTNTQALELGDRAATFQQGQGQLSAAISLFERSLAFYRAAGRMDEAITLYEQVLTDCRRLLGDNHPTTAVLAQNLDQARAVTRPQQGGPTGRGNP